ncbi:hypothetical protein ACN6KF_004410 [Labrys sp. La1]|uniref:hypothetical protein n=1 Tax=Labrys sp. La1 TaxID=3404917 RepID=UPI003EB7BA11
MARPAERLKRRWRIRYIREGRSEIQPGERIHPIQPTAKENKKERYESSFSFFLTPRLPCFLAVHNLFTGDMGRPPKIRYEKCGKNSADSGR